MQRQTVSDSERGGIDRWIENDRWIKKKTKKDAQT